jgi:hypothetical protein
MCDIYEPAALLRIGWGTGPSPKTFSSQRDSYVIWLPRPRIQLLARSRNLSLPRPIACQPQLTEAKLKSIGFQSREVLRYQRFGCSVRAGSPSLDVWVVTGTRRQSCPPQLEMAVATSPSHPASQSLGVLLGVRLAKTIHVLPIAQSRLSFWSRWRCSR